MIKLYTIAVCGMFALVGTPYKSVAADDNPDAAKVDAQIVSYLNKIEVTLATDDKASFVDLIRLLVMAGELLPIASVEGHRFAQDFPARLRSLAKIDQESIRAINLTIFANASSPYLTESKTPEVNLEIIPATTTEPSIAPNLIIPATALEPLMATAPSPSITPSIAQQNLLDRGDTMLDLGDISAARLLYRRVAYSGIGIAALRLADTYDPAFLAEHHVFGIKPDVTEAEKWYRKAASLGASQADQRLKSLLAKE